MHKKRRYSWIEQWCAVSWELSCLKWQTQKEWAMETYRLQQTMWLCPQCHSKQCIMNAWEILTPLLSPNTSHIPLTDEPGTFLAVVLSKCKLTIGFFEHFKPHSCLLAATNSRLATGPHWEYCLKGCNTCADWQKICNKLYRITPIFVSCNWVKTIARQLAHATPARQRNTVNKVWTITPGKLSAVWKLP